MKIDIKLVNENLAHARNGEVVLYKRGDSNRWQARFKLKDLKWHRTATKQINIEYAAQAACEAYDRAQAVGDAKADVKAWAGLCRFGGVPDPVRGGVQALHHQRTLDESFQFG